MYLLSGAAGCRQPPAPREPPPTSPPETHPTADTGHPCGPPSVELGNGVTEHVPMRGTAEMVHGLQGGWHIDVSGAVAGLGPLVALHADVIRVSDGLRIAGDQQPKAIELTSACGGEFAGLQALLDDVQPDVPYQDFICSLVGEMLLVQLDVTDLAAPDRVAIDAVEIVAAPDPDDPCGP